MNQPSQLTLLQAPIFQTRVHGLYRLLKPVGAVSGLADLLLKYSEFTRKKLETFLAIHRHKSEEYTVVV